MTYTWEIITTINVQYTLQSPVYNSHLGINACSSELSIGIFRHLKLELLTQFAASNDKKDFY